jgi:hypothetical protein
MTHHLSDAELASTIKDAATRISKLEKEGADPSKIKRLKDLNAKLHADADPDVRRLVNATKKIRADMMRSEKERANKLDNAFGARKGGRRSSSTRRRRPSSTRRRHRNSRK